MRISRIACVIAALAMAAAGLACSADTPGAPSSILPGPTGSVLQATGDGAAGRADSPAVARSHTGREYADVSNQGGMGVYAPNGASIIRQPNGLQVSLSMPTPEPGSYAYPAGFAPGHPEVFTLWVFVFDDPGSCMVPHDCGPVDILGPNPVGAAYNAAGHPASGAHLTLAGRVGTNDTPFAGVPFALPNTAAVHLAVAPHGGLNPSTLPDEFRLPTGNPAFWWVALFD